MSPSITTRAQTQRGSRYAQKGFSLVELIFAIGAFVILIAGTTFLISGSYTAFVGSGNSREMERLAQEGLEVAKIIKEKSWSAIAAIDSDNPSAYKVLKDGSGDWSFQAASSTHGVFERGVYVYNVQRNSSGDIVASGGTNDPATKRIQVIVLATGKPLYITEEYITNWDAFQMYQAAWRGAQQTGWDTTTGSSTYSSHTQMDLATTSSQLMIGPVP